MLPARTILTALLPKAECEDIWSSDLCCNDAVLDEVKSGRAGVPWREWLSKLPANIEEVAGSALADELATVVEGTGAKWAEALRRRTGIDLECLRLRFPVLRKRLLARLTFVTGWKVSAESAGGCEKMAPDELERGIPSCGSAAEERASEAPRWD